MKKKKIGFKASAALTATAVMSALLSCFPFSLSTAAELNGLTYKVYDDYVEITGGDESLVDLEIPAEIENLPVQSIATNAFSKSPNLKSVIIPEGVLKIGQSVFEKCPELEYVTLPASLNHIGDYALRECDNLKEINVDEKNETFYSTDGILFFRKYS